MVSRPARAPELPDADARRLFLALLVAVTALVCAALLWSQPATGTVRGVCVDAVSGLPLTDADVSLSLKDDARDDADAPPAADSETTLAGPPLGWTQDSKEDKDVGLSGGPSAPQTEWHTRTDAQGRFMLSRVRVGEYTLSASTAMHSSDDKHSVVVLEEQAAQITLPLKREEPTLSFSATTLDWTPTEAPLLPLQGALRTRILRLTLDKLDIGGALYHKPSLLARSIHDDSPEKKPLWAGEFSPVRHWTYTVGHADKEGSFYERLPLGPLSPGLYRVSASADEESKTVTATGWVRVTNLALVRKSYGTQTLAFVSDLTTGRPVPNAALRLYAEGDSAHLLGRATTGADGLAHLSAAGAAAESDGILVAQAGASTVALSYGLNTPNTESGNAEGDEPALGTAASVAGRSLRAFLYTDRPVYRPGQIIHLEGISRWFDRGKGFALPAARPVNLDVRDPQDNLVKHADLTTDDLGAWNMALTLSSEALTGEYTVQALMDGHKEQATFDVAAYHKPEYSATVTFSRPRYVHGDTVDVTVTATYYYGSPVSGAKATLRGFSSGDEGEGDGPNTSGEPSVERQVTLDGNGQAFLRLPTKSGAVGGDEEYTVDADVDDASGHAVSAEAKATVAQGEFSLSATPDVYACHKGDKVTVTVSARNAQDAPQVGQDVEVSADYAADTPDGKAPANSISDTHVTTGSDGRAAATVTAAQNGLLSIHTSGTDRRGNKVTADVGVWVPGDTAQADRALPARLSDLSVVLDRAKYAPGQTAHVLINTAHPGPAALVTVEGTTLYRAFTVALARHSNALDLPVTLDDAPSVRVKVCAVNAKQFESSDATLTMDDDRRGLQVSLSTDKTAYRPGGQATIIVHTRDASGAPVPAEVSLGVVDGAIYAIKPEAPQTIADAFQPAQEDAVQTDYSCKTETLGDVDKGAASIDIRHKFPDTALWRPALRTGPDGNAAVQFTLPDTLTTWRITSYGHTADTRVGKAVAAVTVSKDLLVRLEAPPFLLAGDTGRLIGLVHNNTNKRVQATVHLSAPGLAVVGDAAQTVDVEPGKPARLTWTVTAPSAIAATGTPPVPIQLTASSGGLSDGVEEPIPLLPHGVVQNLWHSGTLLRSVSQSVTLDPSAILGGSRLTVRLAPSISTTLLPAVVWISGYPYESTDATTSTLICGAAVLGAPGLITNANTRARLQNVATRSALRLVRLQSDSGGWGWFSTSKPDIWMTAWAAWGLASGRSSGFPIPAKVQKAAGEKLASLANNERGHGHPDEAYVSIAALALASGGDAKNALANLHWLQARWRGPNALPQPADLARAALAEQALGGEEAGEAQTLMRRLWDVGRQTGTLVSWTSGGHRTADGAGTELPDADATAWALLAGETITPDDARIDGAARWLMTARSGNHWASPTLTAVAVRALAVYEARGGEAAPDFQAHVLVNGHEVKTVRFTPASVDQPEVSLDIPDTALQAGENTVTLHKEGSGRLYYSLELRQCLAQPAPDLPVPLLARVWNAVFHPKGNDPPPAPSGFRLRRTYLRTTSRRNWLWEDTVPAPDTRLNAGEGVLVRLIINATRPAARVIIEEPLPAGFRVAEVSGEDTADWSNWWDYTDVRDDRVVFFISDLTPGQHEIDYHLQATTPGTYDVMPTQMGSVVDPSLAVLGRPAHMTVDAKD